MKNQYTSHKNNTFQLRVYVSISKTLLSSSASDEQHILTIHCSFNFFDFLNFFFFCNI